MSDVVTLRGRPAGPDDAPRCFELYVEGWEALLDLGRAHGWNPLGTVADPGAFGEPSHAGCGSLGDYDARRATSPCCLTAADAAAWAAALERAPGAPKAQWAAWTRVLRSRLQPGEEAAPEVTQAFVRFLREGAFAFAYTD